MNESALHTLTLEQAAQNEPARALRPIRLPVADPLKEAKAILTDALCHNPQHAETCKARRSGMLKALQVRSAELLAYGMQRTDFRRERGLSSLRPPNPPPAPWSRSAPKKGGSLFTAPAALSLREPARPRGRRTAPCQWRWCRRSGSYPLARR